MWMWLWVVGVLFSAVVVALWVDRHRGSRGESRGADLPAIKHGRPKRVDFDHTIGPCRYDVGPDGKSGLTGSSARVAYRRRP